MLHSNETALRCVFFSKRTPHKTKLVIKNNNPLDCDPLSKALHTPAHELMMTIAEKSSGYQQQKVLALLLRMFNSGTAANELSFAFQTLHFSLLLVILISACAELSHC